MEDNNCVTFTDEQGNIWIRKYLDNGNAEETLIYEKDFIFESYFKNNKDKNLKEKN